jgi:hypothetical protein
VLIELGIRAIPLGIAAMVLGFILGLAGMQVGPAETGSLGSGTSNFGTTHPDIFQGSRPQGQHIRLASLEPQIGFDVAAHESDMVEDASTSTCRNPSLDERFTFLNNLSTSFDNRFASADGCPASFDDRFRSAIGVLTSSLRSSPDQQVQIGRAGSSPKLLIVSKPDVRSGQARKKVLLPEDDGHTAIYDITAHTVYLPSGRRLEAHSGLGSLMDNPGNVHVRMRGSTPPNVYNLALREHLFHGVRAIRLNPVDDSRMHGRAGILAHSYMLGSNGQSNGCVSFSNYPEFLNAFVKGEVSRLVVVERLESPPGKLAAGRLPAPVRDLLKATSRSRQYAAAAEH